MAVDLDPNRRNRYKSATFPFPFFVGTRRSGASSMKRWMIYPVGLAVAIGLGSATPAQGPMAAPGPPTSVGAAAAPVAAGGKASCLTGLCGMLGNCHRKCCQSPLGQLLDGMFKPVSMFSGGIIPTPCPGPDSPTGVPDPNALPGGPDGAASTAEKIKKEEAEAKARRAAVRYLGTVDCHYYPEAEKALIISLRTDRNECVRWEAAMALGHGCCCTKRTIAALAITVSASQRDGNPAETSPRVRVAACNALEHCLSNCPECQSSAAPIRPELPPRPEPQPDAEMVPPPPAEPPQPEYPPGSARSDRAEPGVQLAAYYTAVDAEPVARVVADARRVLAEATVRPAPPAAPPRGKRNLHDLWAASAAQPGVPHRAPALEPVPEAPRGTAYARSLRQDDRRWPDEPRVASRRPRDQVSGPLFEPPAQPPVERGGPFTDDLGRQPEAFRYPSTGMGDRRALEVEGQGPARRQPPSDYRPALAPPSSPRQPVRLPSPYPSTD